MTGLQHLRALYLAKQCKTHPNTPLHVLPRWKDGGSPERKELKRIVAFINLSGGMAQITDSKAKRVDNRTTYVDGVGFARVMGSVEYRKSDLRPGTSDISATIDGVSYFIELKREYKNGKDRQSAVQKEFQKMVEAAGGVYIIVSSFEDYYKWNLSK